MIEEEEENTKICFGNLVKSGRGTVAISGSFDPQKGGAKANPAA
jgi:hypothetical protein